MKSGRPATILFCLALLGFLIAKFQVLDSPFFWDEVGVYGRMSFHLADNGPSLHPKAVDQWLSRGHPLLYPFFISLFCKLFGTSVFIAHLANLLLAVALVVSVFVHVSLIQNRLTGFFSVAILMSQPIFFAQSGMVLPEIALALALWWCTWTYYKQKLIPFVIAGSAAVLIKEPAIVWICVLALYDFLLGKKRFTIRSLKWLMPILVFGIFLIVQKNTWGWFLFPYHSGSINFTISEIQYKFMLYLKFLFLEQGRVFIPITIVLGMILAIVRSGSFKQFFKSARNSYLALSLAVFAGYLIFSSLTFHLWRYMIPLFPFLAMVTGLSINMIMSKGNLYVAVVLFLGCTLFPLSKMNSDHFVYDCDMSYLRAIDVNKKALLYMIDYGIYQPGKFSVNMPLIYIIMDNRFGYLPDSIPSYHSSQISENTEFAVALTPGTSLENPNNLPLELIHEQFYHDIKMSVYKVVVDTVLRAEGE